MIRSFRALAVLAISCLAAGQVRPQCSPLEKKPAVETAHAESTGLLLGAYFPKDGTWDMLRNDSPDQKWVPDISQEPHGKYITFWISRSGGTVKIQPTEGLLVPRANGFWHVGTRIVHADQDPESNYDEQFWAAPAGEKPKPPQPPVDPDSEIDGSSVRLITYLGPEYVAYLFHWRGGAGDWEYVYTHVTGLDSLATNASIEKVLGPEAEGGFKSLAKSLDHMRDEPCPTVTGHDDEWGILHEGDSWHAYSRFHQGPSSSCQAWEDHDLKAPIPKSIALPEPLDRPWDVLRGEAEAILKTGQGAVRHLFISPKRDLAVAVGTNGLAILGVENGHITSVLKAQAFDAPCIPVMEQWSLGRFVGAWDTAVQKEHPAAVPEPGNP